MGVVVGFLLLVVLSVYGYSVYWWREHGLYGNVKPYKYTKATSKDDDDANGTRAVADSPMASGLSTIPLSQLKQMPPLEPASPAPASPLPVAQPVKAVSTADSAAATPPPVPSVAATAAPAPAPAKAAAAVLPPVNKAKPPASTSAASKPAAAKPAPAKSGPALPTTPLSPAARPAAASGGGTAATHDANGRRIAAPTSPKSPKSDTMPEGWGLHKDASGNQYYFNTATGQSQWSKPSK